MKPFPRFLQDRQTDAACYGKEDLFFGPEDEDHLDTHIREQAAIQVCATCPVTTACLDHALTHPEKHGVWGAVGETDRERLRRRRQREKQPKRRIRNRKIRVGHMSIVGDARILQGLAVQGYGLKTVRAWTRITISTLQAVRAKTRKSWAKSSSQKLRSALPDILDEPTQCNKVRIWALSQGWVDLKEWDIDHIDDPDATPHNQQAS